MNNHVVKTQVAKRTARNVVRALMVCAVVAGLAACALLITGCGTTKGFVRVDGLAVEGETLARGTAVTIESEEGNYYKVKLSDGKTSAWIEKWLVRADSAAAPAETKAYAASGAKVYSTAYFTEEIASLDANAEVTVLDSFGDALYVKTAAGVSGYMNARDTMSSPATAKSYSGSSSSSKSSSSNSSSSNNTGTTTQDTTGGSSSGSTGSDSGSTSSGGSTQSSDGEEISLTSMTAMGLDAVGAVLTDMNPFRVDVAYADTQSTSAKILSDGTKTIVAFFDRDSEVEIVKTENDKVTLRINGKDYTVDAKYIRSEKEAKPETKQMYAVQGAVVCPHYPLTAEQVALPVNTVVTVVDQIDDVLVVQVDGQTYYTTSATLSETQVEVPVASNTSRSNSSSSSRSSNSTAQPTQEQSSSSGQSSGSGDAGSSSSSSSGSSGTQESTEQQWTKPTK